MYRNRGTPSVRVSELLVRAPVSNLSEAERNQNPDNVTRPQDREARHLRCDRLNPYELGFELWVAVLEEHGNNFFKVLGEFLASGALGMRPGKARNVTD